MRTNSMVWSTAAGCIAALMAQAAFAANVKVTPLGGQEGEFCPQDRALIFEDPNGTRILYDAGRTVAGPSDPRLGKIDVILVSHMHGDHVGNAHIEEPMRVPAQIRMLWCRRCRTRTRSTLRWPRRRRS